MSIFKDQTLKGVADAVSKIIDEELKGSQHKIDANKNGKIDAHDFKLLRGKKDKVDTKQQARNTFDGMFGGGNPANKLSIMKKEEIELEERAKWRTSSIAHNTGYRKDGAHGGIENTADTGKEDLLKNRGRGISSGTPLTKYDTKVLKKSITKNLAQMKKEETELDEAFPTVADAKKRMDAGKTATGSVTKTKTGLVHKREYKDDDTAATDTQKKASGYGARQNFNRSKRVNEQKLSFTEMLQLYNESGVEVINKIAPQTVKFGDTEVELIDANIVNGAVGITVAEEVDNETFTKEVEAQKAKNAGGGKKAEVAKASVQAVKQEAVEQIDEISADLAGKYLLAPKGKGANKYKTGEGTSRYPNADTMIKHGKSMKRALQRADTSSLNKKPSYYKEEEQLDEVSKKTLGSYIKAASHDVAAKGAFTRHFADKSRAETAEQKHDIAHKTMKKADKMQDAGMKRRANMAKAVDRLTKEDVEQMDERTLTPSETSKKEEIVKSMKKGLSGFKQRYGERAKEVMYATATKQAKKD